MNATDLMVGDWVYNTHNRQNEHVQEIGSGLVMLDYNDLYEYDEIEPIPLTPEILEKNGFEVTRNISSSRNKDVWSLHVSKYKIFHITEHHNKKIFPYFWIEIGSNSDIKYVHQLQHALRLCGIEKEIVL